MTAVIWMFIEVLGFSFSLGCKFLQQEVIPKVSMRSLWMVMVCRFSLVVLFLLFLVQFYRGPFRLRLRIRIRLVGQTVLIE